MTKKPTTAFCLVLALSLSTLAIVDAQTQQEYVLALGDRTWDHSIITVLVSPPSNESWWNPAYLNGSLHAIDEWNEAISYFASNYSDFAYLSRLSMTPQVSNSMNVGFDVYISWIERFGNATCEAGLTTTWYTPSNKIINSTISMSAYDCFGNVLDETDAQNVALHEIGHCLGLGHSNFTGDTMYYAYTLNSPVRAISTLDVYGVSQVFRWMANSQEYNSVNQGSPINSVTLPSNINYKYLPIAEKNLPPQSTLDQIRTFLDNFTEYILPIGLVLIIVAVTVIPAYVIITRKRKKRATS
jgi:predicted Zn-dependent protease